MILFIIWTAFVLGNAAAFVMTKRVPARIRKQVLPVLVILLLFSLASVRHMLALERSRHLVFTACASSGVTLAALVCGLLRDRSLLRFNRQRALIFGGILLVFTASSLYEIHTYPLWDAAVYAEAAQQAAASFDFGLRSWVQEYFLCSHVSLGLTFFWLGGEFLIPGSAGVLLAQVVLGGLSACAFYETLFCLKSERSAAPVRRYDPAVLALTALYLFSPALFGMVGDLSVDYGLLCLLPFMVLAAVKKWGYLELLASLAFCLTKEPAVMIYAGLAGILILHSLRRRRFGTAARRAVPGIVWAALYFFAGHWGGDSSFTSGGDNSFGFDLPYILNKLKQFALADLNWLLLLALAAAAVWAFACRRKGGEKAPAEKDGAREPYISGLCCGFLLYAAFSCLFITSVHYRYVMVATYLYVFLLAAALFRVPGGKAVKAVSVSLLSLALLAQSFVNIDFVSAKAFPSFPVNDRGGQQMSLSYFNDSIIYNRSYRNYTGLVEKALTEAGADDWSAVAIADEDLAWSFAGWWPHGYCLNLEKGRLALSEAETDVRFCVSDGNIVPLDEVPGLDPYGYRKIICIDFPWNGYAAEGIADEYMNVEKTFTVTHNGWDAKVRVGTIREAP